ncbi:MAG: sugar ABC transporter permease [Clostridiaceae bacterium]|nr:sugar ABC transporter permease [Clostridiaceae bacterium]
MEGKIQENKSIKKKKNKFHLSESKTGYLMIAPAIIIIMMIAFYPVIKSFWYSMFDLRLNNPTRNSTFLNYKFDMERYFSNYDLAKAALTNASKDAKGEDKGKLTQALTELTDLNIKILAQNAISSKEQQVRKYTNSFQAIPDERLKYIVIDKTVAVTTHNKFISLRKEFIAITADTAIKADVNKASGLIEELRDSFITPNFVGLSNYLYYLNPSNDRFWGGLSYTFIFTVISVLVELVLGIFCALIISRSFRGIGVVRASILVPWAIPTVVSAVMWKFLYDGQNGFIAHLFAQLHLIKNAGILLTTHNGATFAAIFTDVWKTTPYMALLLLAGLQNIDSSLYEAANVDGAGKIYRFFKITLPLLKPTILVALLFRTLDAFRVFDLIYVLTGGANSTETLSTLAYKTMFAQMEFGKGSTLSVIAFLCVAIISMAYIKILGADVLSGKE